MPFTCPLRVRLFKVQWPRAPGVQFCATIWRGTVGRDASSGSLGAEGGRTRASGASLRAILGGWCPAATRKLPLV